MTTERQEQEQPLRTHLGEMRRRLTRTAIVVILCTGLAFAFHREILDFLLEPVRSFDDSVDFKPIFTEMTEMLGVVFKISILTGLILAVPYVLYETVMFVSPGLTSRERRYFKAFLPLTVIAFGIGAAFGYYILFPPALHFLINFGTDIADPYIRIGNYINVITMLLFWMGIVFETPIVMFLLARFGVVSHKKFAAFRRFAVLLAFVLGAIITPTFDPINQTLVALPIIALYEVGIWLARFSGRKKDDAPTPESKVEPSV